MADFTEKEPSFPLVQTIDSRDITGPLNPADVERAFQIIGSSGEVQEASLIPRGPSAVDMRAFVEAVNTITFNRTQGGKKVNGITRVSGIRHEYGLVHSSMTPFIDSVRKHGYFKFTRYKSETDEEELLGIYDPSLYHVKEAVKALAQSGKVTVIMPFHHEQGTVGGNIAYAQSLIGQHNVLGISTGDDIASTREAQASGGIVLEQNEIFEALHTDWDAIREGVGINDGLRGVPILGSKGLTIFGGVSGITVLAEHGRIDPDQIVAWHDTDITDPHEYGALPTVLIPFLRENLEEARVLMSILAKNGSGRNNEMILGEIADTVNYSSNSQLIRLALQLFSTPWPLSGERAFHLDTLRNMPIATGMGIEIMADTYVAGLSATEQGYIANVANPYPKRENKESPPEREFGVVNTVNSMLIAIKKHIHHTHRYPHQWTLEDIKLFNDKYGGKELVFLVPSNKSNAENAAVTIQLDYILPSINMMLKHGMMKID